MGVTMNEIANVKGMSQGQKGLAIPATPQAAGNNNVWDLNLLSTQLLVSDIRNVATWALGYDKTNNWALADMIATLNNQLVMAAPTNLATSSALPTSAATAAATSNDSWATSDAPTT